MAVAKDKGKALKMRQRKPEGCSMGTSDSLLLLAK